MTSNVRYTQEEDDIIKAGRRRPDPLTHRAIVEQIQQQVGTVRTEATVAQRWRLIKQSDAERPAGVPKPSPSRPRPTARIVWSPAELQDLLQLAQQSGASRDWIAISNALMSKGHPERGWAATRSRWYRQVGAPSSNASDSSSDSDEDDSRSESEEEHAISTSLKRSRDQGTEDAEDQSSLGAVKGKKRAIASPSISPWASPGPSTPMKAFETPPSSRSATHGQPRSGSPSLRLFSSSLARSPSPASGATTSFSSSTAAHPTPPLPPGFEASEFVALLSSFKTFAGSQAAFYAGRRKASRAALVEEFLSNTVDALAFNQKVADADGKLEQEESAGKKEVAEELMKIITGWGA